MTAVDAHLHLFPDEASGLLAQGGERLAGHAGVIDEVRRIASQGGIGRFVATTAIGAVLREFGQSEDQIWTQYETQNDWICQLAEEEPVIAAGLAADPTLDPSRVAAHLRDRLARHDVAAIKVHPAIAKVMPDDPGFAGIYDVAAEADVPVVSHGGSSEGAFYEAEVQYCAPANFAPVLERFPNVQLVIAHLGQPYYDDLLAVAAAFPNVWTDLSFVLGARLVPLDRLAGIVRSFGVDRVMFGTDFPFFDPTDSLNALTDAGFTAAEFDAITTTNAERLFFSR